MIDERKVLQHSKESCYMGVGLGCVASIIAWSLIPLVVGAVLSLAAVAVHYDLKSFIKKETK